MTRFEFLKEVEKTRQEVAKLIAITKPGLTKVRLERADNELLNAACDVAQCKEDKLELILS